MATKCTNPACLALFRDLERGRVFRVEIEVGASPLPTTKYLWLCHDCAVSMTLCLDVDGGVNLLPVGEHLQKTHRRVDAEYIWVNRERRVVLRRLSFLGPTPRGSGFGQSEEAGAYTR